MHPTQILCITLLIASILLTTSISLPTFYRRKRLSKQQIELHIDEDGTTTRAVQSSFTRRTRIHIIAILLISAVGLTINTTAAISIREYSDKLSNRTELLLITLQILAGLLLAFHGFTIALSDSPIERQKHSNVAALCSLLVLGANALYDATEYLTSRLHLAFFIAHLSLLVISLAIFLTLPRRPSVFLDGFAEKPIDGERTVAVFTRYTLSWANPLLSYAMRHNGLEFHNLSYLDARARANELVSSFNLVKGARLWKRMLRAHRSTITSQWVLTLCLSFATLAPQYLLWRLIRILETNSKHPDPIAALWLVLLGVVQFLQPWIETWMLWVGWCHIALPIFIEFSALIVAKSFRRKDIKDVSTIDNEPRQHHFENLDTQRRLKMKDQSISGDEERNTPKRMQDQINLITVDTQRISDFMSYNSMFMGTMLGIAVSLVFLLTFIRIESILAGMVGVSFIVPLNIYANRRYATAQNDLMHARDLKTAALTEGIQGIRQIKFDALEPQWTKRIRAVRNAELSQQWKAYLAETLLMMCWIAGPIMFAAITLSVISAYEGNLSPSTAFTALAVFQRLEGTLSLVPQLVTDFSNALVSLNRIESFLNLPERYDATISADVIAFEGTSIAWPSDGLAHRTPILQSLDFSFPKNELSIIVGPTGVGKSLLLAAIVGEAEVLAGTVRRPRPDGVRHDHNSGSLKDRWIIPKSTAFVTQTPWIENASIRDNILFGLPFAESRYELVLHACAFVQDINIMEDGDVTEVGAHGVSLSGGQRSRLSLARALYSRAEILIIDDIFSAVDTHVGRHLLDHALVGSLADNRTRLVATHNMQLCLAKATFAVMLEGGCVKYAGSSQPLLQKSSLNQHIDGGGMAPVRAEKVKDSPLSSSISDGEASLESGESGSEARVMSLIDPRPVEQRLNVSLRKEEFKPKKFTPDEQREKGRTKLKVYKGYLRAASRLPWVYWSVVVTLLVGFEVALVGRNWWVKSWSEGYVSVKAGNTRCTVLAQDLISNYSTHAYQHVIDPSLLCRSNHHRNTFYLVGCILISLIVSLLGTFKFFWVYLGSLRASRDLSDHMTISVLHAPLRWFDTVPTGRILNRFVADFNVVDSRIADDLVLLVYSGLQLAGIITAGALVSPFLLLLAAPLLVICVIYARQYLAGARDVKRLESTKRSPVIEQIDSMLSGLQTIRAYDKSAAYTERIYSYIDDHARCVWHLWLFNRWLGMRFALIGAIFTLCVASFAVYSPKVSAALAGLALTFSLEFTSSVFWFLRRYADIEMDMNSLERITEFCNLPTESSDGVVPPAHWPSQGRIEISNLEAAYAPDLPLVLKGLSFNCQPNSRVGIIGRTGAGKSSLTLALFRFLEAQSGTISIDGLDISTLTLHELRERIAIIPQHPNLWLGSVRSNLDPFDTYSDGQLQDVLDRVQLGKPVVSPQPSEASDTGDEDPSPPHLQTFHPAFKLSSPISEGGLNLSLGQRQLICLARALLSRPKILVMDEATSAVDAETDAIVQRSIREELKECTLLVIAHKLSTVVDMDKIVVMQEGRVVEMGEPRELWGMEGGMFRDMVRQSGEGGLVERLK